MVKVKMTGSVQAPPPKLVKNLPKGFFVGKLCADLDEELYLATGGCVIQLSTSSGDPLWLSGECEVKTYRAVDLEITVKEKG